MAAPTPGHAGVMTISLMGIDQSNPVGAGHTANNRSRHTTYLVITPYFAGPFIWQ
jgi:hypothetical protein